MIGRAIRYLAVLETLCVFSAPAFAQSETAVDIPEYPPYTLPFSAPQALLEKPFMPLQVRNIQTWGYGASEYREIPFTELKIVIDAHPENGLCSILSEELANDFSEFLISENPRDFGDDSILLPAWTPIFTESLERNVDPYIVRAAGLFSWLSTLENRHLAVRVPTLNSVEFLYPQVCDVQNEQCGDPSATNQNYLGFNTIKITDELTEEKIDILLQSQRYSLLFPPFRSLTGYSRVRSEDFDTYAAFLRDPRHQLDKDILAVFFGYRFMNFVSYNDLLYIILFNFWPPYQERLPEENFIGDAGFIVWPVDPEIRTPDPVCFFDLDR